MRHKTTPAEQAKFLTPQQLGRRWGYCDKTIRRWIRAEELRAMRVKRQYRVPIEEVERFERTHLGSP